MHAEILQPHTETKQYPDHDYAHCGEEQGFERYGRLSNS